MFLPQVRRLQPEYKGFEEENKLASLEATLVRNSAQRPTHLLTGVKCRATSVAKKVWGKVLKRFKVSCPKWWGSSLAAKWTSFGQISFFKVPAFFCQLSLLLAYCFFWDFVGATVMMIQAKRCHLLPILSSCCELLKQYLCVSHLLNF